MYIIPRVELAPDVKRKVLFSDPGCAPFAQHAARALHEARLLTTYVTCFHYQPDDMLDRSLRLLLRSIYRDPGRELTRRSITEISREYVVSHPVPELLRMLPPKLGFGSSICDLVWERTEKWFDSIVARKHLNGAGAVYAYEHAALATFRAQKACGGLCIYEQPIAHHLTASEILDAEFAEYPEAETAHDRHLRRYRHRRNQRKDEELRLADLVIVNTTFTKRSLLRAGIPENYIKVVPLGAPSPVPDIPVDSKSPFIFLSAGTQSVRKGVHYLLQAWRKLAPRGDDVELWLVGKMSLAPRLLERLPGRVVIRPSVPRQELFDLYRSAGVLVFPSLCEGFGMVITEAMAHNLPVITTRNTAGPDLIDSGKNGFIVPIRDSEKLAETMQWCIDHRSEVRDIGRAAAGTVSRWQWNHYRAALGAAVDTFMSESLPPRVANHRLKLLVKRHCFQAWIFIHGVDTAFFPPYFEVGESRPSRWLRQRRLVICRFQRGGRVLGVTISIARSTRRLRS